MPKRPALRRCCMSRTDIWTNACIQNTTQETADNWQHPDVIMSVATLCSNDRISQLLAVRIYRPFTMFEPSRSVRIIGIGGLRRCEMYLSIPAASVSANFWQSAFLSHPSSLHHWSGAALGTHRTSVTQVCVTSSHESGVTPTLHKYGQGHVTYEGHEVHYVCQQLYIASTCDVRRGPVCFRMCCASTGSANTARGQFLFVCTWGP
jgi:hypothetical protein